MKYIISDISVLDRVRERVFLLEEEINFFVRALLKIKLLNLESVI